MSLHNQCEILHEFQIKASNFFSIDIRFKILLSKLLKDPYIDLKAKVTKLCSWFYNFN